MTKDYVFRPPNIVSAEIANSDVRFPVRRIFCVGRNYSNHINEMGGDSTKDFPVFFTKPADALIADKSTINFPMTCSLLHHEVELVVAINKPLYQADEETAARAVFGLAVGVDLTRRDMQKSAKENGLPWDCAKGFDQSAPMGSIKQIDKLPSAISGKIDLSVNGYCRQSSNLDQMIWSVPQILARLSILFHLQPGDLVFTGTPDGVGELKAGDFVAAQIEGIGDLQFNIAG